MPKKIDQLQLIEEPLKTGICVPAIQKAVERWRSGGYKGVTETTRELLNFWFEAEHILPNRERFQFHKAQREAIETLIYLYEVAKHRSRKDLLKNYSVIPTEVPTYDEFARYCIKMATGSGKTIVIALSVVWQFANYLRGEKDYANTFLILSPNVIVFDRLKTDFENGNLFKRFPFLPRHLEWLWDMQYYMRGDGERTHSEGALYLTNIQQFYERSSKVTKEEVEVMTAVLGSPVVQTDLDLKVPSFEEQIAKREGLLMIINDEAHHTHDEKNEWNEVIRKLHKRRSLCMQLDLSATPRYTNGKLFSWTIYDYPLKQAIQDKIVKQPVKGIAQIEEVKSEHPTKKYEGYLVAGVERWKEYKEALEPLQKKPVLFIMMNTTEEAEEVGSWLRRKYPNYFADEKTLIIHTDKKGEITKNDLEIARKLAREIDRETSPVNAIVSVLMLREGWDVQSVTVVVGLRPYSAKANILPEQTIGRGLRLMFRNQLDYVERVDIIGNRAFLEFVEELENLEDCQFATFEVGKDKLKIQIIQPEETKLQYDIAIPEISPLLERKKSISEEISSLDVSSFETQVLPLEGKEISELKKFIYEGRDILTDEQILKREYSLPEVQSAEEVIAYYASRIAQNLKLPSHFAVLAKKIKEFFELKAFGRQVDLNDSTVIRAMSSSLASYVVLHEFEKALKSKIIEQKKPTLLTEKRFLSSTPPFPTSKKLCSAKKTVFNYLTYDSEFEAQFVKFLDNAEDVKAFVKLPEQFGFYIQYIDSSFNLRNYFPDFVVVDSENTHWVIETKGQENINVLLKDEAAKSWCETATGFTQVQWKYLKVLQKEFEKLQPESLENLTTLLNNTQEK